MILATTVEPLVAWILGLGLVGGLASLAIQISARFRRSKKRKGPPPSLLD